MTIEEKDLLLKDLCTRLPYGVKAHIEHDVFYDERDPYDCTLSTRTIDDFIRSDKLEVKPYLRPMSSMTEEECIELSHLFPSETDVWKYIKTPVPLHIANPEQFDFFHKKHLDWRGLIPKGLALEAPNGMYKD